MTKTKNRKISAGLMSTADVNKASRQSDREIRFAIVC